MIENPILRGFNPDPSIIKIDNTYYIATSTFEWFPGVNIYSSTDMVNWKIHSRPLNKKALLDLTGVPDGGGVWAPCLSYDGKKAYLVYTVVKERGTMMQTDNYLIETEDINGEWSDRVYLNSIGFDPSLFHDEDGRKYLISLENHYERNKRFNGLYIEEYDPYQKRLIGGRRLLYASPTGELVEGSHIYKKDGYYYLLKAQGGTGVRHSAQMARSKSLLGEWEEDTQILLHARDDESLPLQKAGHADIIETPWGMYMVHLASRSLGGICGRETCLQKVCWKNGWLRLEKGGNTPYVKVEAPGEKAHIAEEHYDFTKGCLSADFQFLREDITEKISFDEKGLHLKGGSGLNSKFDQSLIARRIDEENTEIEACIDFDAENDRQLAGLTLIYDTCHWHYLYITKGDGFKVAKLLSCDKGSLTYYSEQLKISEKAILSVKIENGKAAFYVNKELLKADVDMSILSDEHIHLGFTGAMAGFNCIDCEKREKSATIEYFKYKRTAEN